MKVLRIDMLLESTSFGSTQVATTTADAVKALFIGYGVVVGGLILLTVAIIILGGGWIRSWLTRHAQASVEKELESHKAQLKADAEEIRLTHQRKLDDFTRYSSKRHRTYPDMYKLLLMTEGGLNGLWGIKFGRSWEGMSQQQVLRWTVEQKLPEKAVGQALITWDSDPELARTRLDDLLDKVEANRALNNLTKARNYQLVNKLYFSSSVDQVVENAYQVLAKYSVHAKDGDSGDYEKLSELKTQGHIAVEAVREAMQRELGRGDYESDRAKS